MQLNNELFHTPDSVFNPTGIPSISSDMLDRMIEEMSAKNLLIDKMINLGMCENVPNVKQKDDHHTQRGTVGLNGIEVPRIDWSTDIETFNQMLNELKDMDNKKDMLGGKKDE